MPNVTEGSTSSPTKEQIAEWKKKHGKIFLLTVGEKKCYLKTPDRSTLGYASKISNESKDPMQFNEVLLNNCWLGGDEEIKTDDGLFLSASAKLDQLLGIKEAELKEV